MKVDLVVTALLALGIVTIVWSQFVRPARRIRKALRAMADGDFALHMLSDHPGYLKNSISDIRRVAERLKEFDRQVTDEEFNLRAILASMVEGVLIVDRSQRIRLANDALVGLFNLSTSPMNRTVIDVFRDHQLQLALEKAFTHGSPQKMELAIENVGRGGGQTLKHFDVHISGLNPKPHARPIAVIIVFHDVTTLRSLEAVRRDFVANVSHEFRTPLAIISGYVETLLDGAISDPDMAEKSLNVVQKNVRRLSLLIDDLLSLSRLDEKAKLLNFIPNDVRHIVLNTLEHLEPKIRGVSAEVTLDWEEGVGGAEVDPARMEEVISNLLGNAIQHGGNKALRIGISARQDDDHLRIAIADNGPGIPLDDQPHIFERFYRVSKDRSREAGGTGLGLSIVKNIVQAHGGTVRVESSPGHGATFHIVLPRRQVGNRPK